MNSEQTPELTHPCPVCETQIPEGATRCPNCGASPSTQSDPAPLGLAAQGGRMAGITLSAPVLIGLMALFLAIGAFMVYFAQRQAAGQAAAAATATEGPTATITVAPTLSPSPTLTTPTVTVTPQPSPTPLTYMVKAGDTCEIIAASFEISIMSILLQNPNLSANCQLQVGQQISIPNPTPTATPPPTATLSPAEATDAACEKVEYEVQEQDTLGGIAINYAVPIEAIREYNGLVNDVVRFGQRLVIPLCERPDSASPTPTVPAPFPAPDLLQPVNGSFFTGGDATISLQWVSVGELEENERYVVTVEDVTAGTGPRLFYASDTQLILDADQRPQGDPPHLFYWSVSTVRETGTDEEGDPIYESAGASSPVRGFIWSAGSS